MSKAKQGTKLFYSIVLMVMSGACLESYQPPSSVEDINYLVADGFINTSKNSATVKLSRTIGLSVGKSLPDESGANVSIESEGGSVFVLSEGTHGNYSSDQVMAEEGKKYRLRIATRDGKKYASKFVAMKSSPSLDSVIWKAGPDGVTVYVNAHDETNQTRYYRWKYTETWRYTSDYLSYFKMENGFPAPRRPDELILICWKSVHESQILITSTLRLNADMVSNFPIALLPAGSQKLMHSYSILVEQRALDEEAYNYWQLLEKTTESLGGLFDPIPSQVAGNISNEEDHDEPVVGYFSGGNVQEKRMFIVLAELPDYLKFYDRVVKGCEIFTLPVEDIANTIGSKVLLDVSGPQWLVATPECADCRAQGGVTTSPDFWPQ